MSEDQSIEAARAQAIEYLGLSKPMRVTVGDKTFEIPNPSLLGREQKKRYDQLQLELESLDRWPDIKNDAGEVIALGQLKTPHRKNGKLVESYDEKLTKALLGDKAEEFFAKGGEPSDVGLFWAEMNQRIVDRSQQDSKSGGSAAHLAVVPDEDRG
jgi:hypothetical protein